MSLHLGEQQMTSTLTRHDAIRVGPGQRWRVSWLPNRTVSRNEALTAMTLAETVTQHPEPDTPCRVLIDGWAGELGMTGVQAQKLITD